MEFNNLKEQAIKVKLNTSNAIRLPAAIRDTLYLKPGQEFEVYLDFISGTLAFTPVKEK